MVQLALFHGFHQISVAAKVEVHKLGVLLIVLKKHLYMKLRLGTSGNFLDLVLFVVSFNDSIESL